MVVVWQFSTRPVTSMPGGTCRVISYGWDSASRMYLESSENPKVLAHNSISAYKAVCTVGHHSQGTNSTSIMNFLLISCFVGSALSQPSTRFGQLETRIPNACATITGSQCVFPFTYKGVEYYQCTYADSPTPWCATQVDADGVVVTNKWGDCETGSLSGCQTEAINLESCTTESGPYADQACVFPFRYNGVTYTTCTTQDKDQAWCSTNTTLAGTHIPGYYGNCPSSCPGAESEGNTCNEADPGKTSLSVRVLFVIMVF